MTGASGFLGTALCRRLRGASHDVVALNSRTCDLTRADSLLPFTQQPYDRIYHLAAWTRAGDFCLHHSGEQWIVNQQINTNVLAWWQKHQPQALLVSVGTSCAYSPDLPLTEENYLVGEPIESLYTYAMTKRMLFQGHRALRQQFGLRYLHLVPSTLYGPGYHTDGRQMHFIFDLIRKIIRGKRFGERVVLWGDGFQKREVVYIDDFVRAALALPERVENEIVNVGCGEELSIREFAAAICDQVGYELKKIEFDTTRYVGAKSKVLAVDRLRHLLPGFRLTSLDHGLRSTIEWFCREEPSLLEPSPAQL